jgi:hypothetical protein
MARRARAVTEDASADPATEPTVEGAFAPDGVDLTAIRWMLERTPTERLQAAQNLIDAVWTLRGVDQD